jgi:hypothetical protein
MLVRARLADNRAAVGVPDKDHRFGLLVEDLSSGSVVASQRQRRVLNDGDVIAVCPEDVVDALPTGAVDESAVDKDHGLSC